MSQEDQIRLEEQRKLAEAEKAIKNAENLIKTLEQLEETIDGTDCPKISREEEEQLNEELYKLLTNGSSFPKKNRMFWGCTRCADKNPTPTCPPPPPPQLPVEEQVRRIKDARDELVRIQQEHQRKIDNIE